MANWLRLVLALVVGAHGLGHILLVLGALLIFRWSPATG
jgi:hypothetical protein